MESRNLMEDLNHVWPDKFVSEGEIFRNIHAGDRIFIGTGCSKPQYLVQSLVNYVKDNPKAFFDAELIDLWALGVAPYIYEKFQEKFRLDSFFMEIASGILLIEVHPIIHPFFFQPFQNSLGRRLFQLTLPLSRPRHLIGMDT